LKFPLCLFRTGVPFLFVVHPWSQLLAADGANMGWERVKKKCKGGVRLGNGDGAVGLAMAHPWGH
jgi:hypothetical protein